MDAADTYRCRSTISLLRESSSLMAEKSAAWLGMVLVYEGNTDKGSSAYTHH